MFGTCATCGNLDLGKMYAYNDFSARCTESSVSIYFSVYSRKIPGVVIKQEEYDQLAIEHLEELGVGCLRWKEET
jgi:hypothetical protein